MLKLNWFKNKVTFTFISALIFIDPHLSCASVIQKEIKNDTQTIMITAPSIIIRGNSHVGDVLLRKSFPVRQINIDESNNILGRFGNSALNTAAASLQPTNIAGVGIRFYHETSTGQRLDYPFSLSSQNVTIDNLVMELVQTAEQTGTGYLTPGNWVTLYRQQGSHRQRMLEATVLPKSVSFISSSCLVDAGSRNILVALPDAIVLEFHGPGSTAGEQHGSIKINCSGGYNPDHAMRNQVAGKLSINFSYQPAGKNLPGVIATQDFDGAAKGIGVQISDGRSAQPLLADKPVEIGTVYAGTENGINFPLLVRYYQTDKKVIAGKVIATAFFNIIYN